MDVNGAEKRSRSAAAQSLSDPYDQRLTMNPVARLVRELKQLSEILEPVDLLRYLSYLVVSAPAILALGSLAPADRLMTHIIRVRQAGNTIRVPVGEITKLLCDNDPTPTFGAVREMYGGNVYLSPFPPDLAVETVVDLGSNRGLFCILARVVLKARTVVGVEPSAYYEPVLQSLIRANGLDRIGLHRITAFAASEPGPGKVTVAEIMAKYDMDRIGFLKCDIEGAEFDVFLRNNHFLEKVDAVAMELHPEHGEARRLQRELEGCGFIVCVTDQFGRNVSSEQANYLFARRRAVGAR